MDAFFKIFRGDLLKYIVSFQKGRAFKDWTDGDLAAKLGHLFILQKHPNLLYSEQAIDFAKTFEITRFLHQKGFPFTEKAMDFAAEIGDLPRLQYFHEHKFPCTEKAMNSAINNGHLEVVRWLHQHRSESCSEQAINGAASWETVQWLKENYPNFSSINILEQAINKNNISLVKLLLANYNYDPATVEQCFINGAANSISDELFHYLWKIAVTNYAEIAHHFMILSATTGNLSRILWLNQECKCDLTENVVYTAVVSGHLNIVEYFLAQEIPFDVYVALAKTRGQHPEIIKKLTEKIAPIDFLLDDVIREGNISLVKWLLEHNYTLDEYSFNAAITSGNLEMIKFIADLVRPAKFSGDNSSDGFTNHDLLTMEQNLEVIKWLITNELVSLQPSVFNSALRNSNVKFLVWWETYYVSEFQAAREVADNILPNPTIEGGFPMIDWAQRHGFVFDCNVIRNAIWMRDKLLIEWALENTQFDFFILETAAYHGLYSLIIKLCGKLHLDIDQIKTNTAIMDKAAECGHLTVIQYLYGQGFKASGEAIKRAALNGHVSMVKWILDNRAPCSHPAPQLLASSLDPRIHQLLKECLETRLKKNKAKGKKETRIYNKKDFLN